MAAPCPSCGATKIDPVRPGLRSRLAGSFGYDLWQCANCRRLRLLEHRNAAVEAEAKGAAAASESSATERPSAEPSTHASSAPQDPDALYVCPRCGRDELRRSRRKWHERFVGRPPMARCRACGYRFPVPQL